MTALLLAASPGAGDPLEVETSLRCGLEEHHGGMHYDLVWQLNNPRGGEMWATWVNDRAPENVLLLPDCPAVNGKPLPHDEACTLYALHPGGHSFAFRDPEADATRSTPEYHELGAHIDALLSRPPGPRHLSRALTRPGLSKPLTRSGRPPSHRLRGVEHQMRQMIARTLLWMLDRILPPAEDPRTHPSPGHPLDVLLGHPHPRACPGAPGAAAGRGLPARTPVRARRRHPPAPRRTGHPSSAVRPHGAGAAPPTPGSPRMTPDALTTAAPASFTAVCTRCDRTTTAAVPIGWTQPPGARGHTLYACPECAPLLTPGPTPGERLGR
ncbi:hypothetical protein ACWF94_25495 [Streptomyces sp. NPDC055078]